jgi:hypothetical protein
MPQSTQAHYDSPKMSRYSSIEQGTVNSTENGSPLSYSSPIDHSALPLAYLVPSNRPARSAISKARQEQSTYHSNFITEIEYGGCPSTLCFELALGGLPGVSWRIGRGCNELEDKGVDLLLVTDDDSIASIHASFGWTIHTHDLLLIILNKQHKPCTINGREFSYGHEPIPLENTILIGDCAFSLLFTPRTRAAETLFQDELRNHVLRLLELKEVEDMKARTVSLNIEKRRRSVDDVDDSEELHEISHDEDAFRSRKRVCHWD